MMKFLPALLILLMLLSGCGAVPPGQEPSRETADAEKTGSAGTELALEGTLWNELCCYPVGDWEAELFSMGDDRLLLIRSEGDHTLLTLLEGEAPVITAETTLSFPLMSEKGGLARWEEGISCFDPLRKETVVLDSSLKEVFRIPEPKNLVGSPLLSRDGTALYYCTPDAIRVLERSTGVSRILKKTDCAGMKLTGLWVEGGYLFCETVAESGSKSFLVSTRTGETRYIDREGKPILGTEAAFYAEEPGCGVFGHPDGELFALYPRQASGQICFLPENHAALTLSPGRGDTVILEYYDLTTGLRVGKVTIPQSRVIPGKAVGRMGEVWFLGADEIRGGTALYRWDPQAMPTGDPTVYTDAYFTREHPDREGLARCETYARELEEAYGIRIRLFEEAVRLLPEGYLPEEEHHAPQLMRTLQLLEHGLSQYPPGFVQTVESRFEGITVCLFRNIREKETGERRDGLQFWNGNHAVIALAVGSSAEGAFYHQFCHLVDTVVLNESSAYDTWSSLNPTGFSYDYSYTANRSRNSTAYLQEANRSFVDMFSTSYPREDRARIMEYAMLPGNDDLFHSETMQRKLHTLCLGIREAFGLETSEEVFLWEQYLR